MGLVIALRLVHIVLGALWAGMMAFTVLFLTPAIRDAGPEGGKVMAQLQRRGVMTVMPIIALLTLVSGVWLVQRVYGGMGPLMASRTGLAFAIGGAAALVAFVVGLALMRPAMARAAALANALASVTNDADRAAQSAQILRLQARGAAVGRVVAVLLLFALGAMAVARYL